MIPLSIDEKDFRYIPLPPETIKEAYDELILLIEKFIEFMKISENISINRAIVGRICERVDQRKDYFLYYHSTETEIMHMSHEKEIALWVYWLCKYKPIRFSNIQDEEMFFISNGCSVNDAFAIFLMLGIVCANNAKKAKVFTPDRIKDIFYDFTNRDINKEMIMSKISDLIE